MKLGRARYQPIGPSPRGLSGRGVGDQLIDNVGEATALPEGFALACG